MSVLRRVVTVAVLAVACSSGVALGPAAQATDADCSQVTTTSDPVATSRPSLPLAEMRYAALEARLAQRHQVPGAGVVVAVLDSGVAASARIPLAAPEIAVTHQPTAYFHGTAVAGLVAGQPRTPQLPVGIAPGARILDVKVYDDPTAEPGQASSEPQPITADHVVAGLRAVLARVDLLGVRIVTIALDVPDDRRVARLIAALWAKGVITVAASGDRSDAENPDAAVARFATYNPGENAATFVHPAHYPHVLAVTSTAQGVPGHTAEEFVLQNSDIRVAAPTALGVSYAVNGGTCVLGTPATSWAAAEVSGILAVLLAAHPHDSPGQAIARLLNTADGRPDIPNALMGAGIVQPDEALTRPVVPRDDGHIDSTTVPETTQRLSPPSRPADGLAATRRHAVWWGLAGGGALVLALVLRPVLARRRTPSTRV